MTIFACFGNIDFSALFIFFGGILGIAFIVVGGIAILIDKIFEVGKRRVLGAETIILLVCGLIYMPMDWGVSMLILLGAIVPGFLLALSALISRIREWNESRKYVNLVERLSLKN